jgi:phosphonate transport system permease protein
MTTLPQNATPALLGVIAERGRSRRSRTLWITLALFIIGLSLYLADILNYVRYGDAVRTITTLLRDAFPPDFSRWKNWGKPLRDTLSMSTAGTAIACFFAMPLAAIAAGVTRVPTLRPVIAMILNVLRSIPLVVWGIACVAAVGFGPLPGALALAIHSTGMLGKFYAEILEHVDPAPGDALRSQGVSRLGVLRFAVLPQILPRVMDVSLYRWEHNVRAAILMGVIGAGGIGLEIMTAFQLFEYREAIALIFVLLLVVTVINWISGRVRRRFLTPTTEPAGS